MSQAAYCVTDTEGVVVMTERAYQPNGTKRAVIWCHANTNNQYEPLSSIEGQHTATEVIVDRLGLPLIAPRCAGTTTWGNDAAQQAVTDARTYIGASWGAKISKVILVGLSMGGLLSLNWARNNPTLVEAIVLLYPAVNLVNHHDALNGSANFSTVINGAYGGQAGYDAAKAAHDPAQHVADYRVFDISMYYSTNDVAVGTQNDLDFATAVGGSRFRSVSLGNVPHPQVGYVPQDDLQDFLAGHL